MFRPLIITWLKRTHKLNTNEFEDYFSMAKIILLECVYDYDTNKKVPFESYYRIKLYHWYGNKMQRKKFELTNLEENKLPVENNDLIEHIEHEQKKALLQTKLHVLNKRELLLYELIIKGHTTKEISKIMNITPKTVLNKKYIIINKLKEQIQAE